MFALWAFEEFWAENPVLEKALLDMIDVDFPLKYSETTVGGAHAVVNWNEFGGVRTVSVEITHPQFSINYEVEFDQKMVDGDKYRVVLSGDDRYSMLESFDGPPDTNAFQPFFAWLADNTAHSTYPAKIKAAAAAFAA